ncbi:MAG: HutD family protein [Burkholderiales bacterium]|nr:HutD family protein [Burkholderiales bacterium]
MNWQVVERADVAPTRWRNGRGTTQELLAWPHADEWRARISIAEIAQDGPFSRYPAAERWFSIIDGAGVTLEVGGGTQVLTPDSEPFRFSGNAEVDCSLIVGKVFALNLITLPRAGRMVRVHDDGYLGVVPARTLVAGYAPSGGTIAVFDDYVLDLAPDTLVWRLLEQEGPVVLEGEDALLLEVRL